MQTSNPRNQPDDDRPAKRQGARSGEVDRADPQPMEAAGLAPDLQDASAVDPHAALEGLQQQLHRLQRSIRIAIQQQLATMAGKSLGSLTANRDLVDTIQAILESHALRVRCNECGHPAILRVSTRPGCSAGVFVFDHTIDGRRTFHGGKTMLPLIHLVAKPARKKRQPAGKKKQAASSKASSGKAPRVAS